MSARPATAYKARPFLKWAGGKSQLLSTIDDFLPASFTSAPEITYIEPFIGGGAMLFFMLQKYSNIKRAVINDINPHLIATYRCIREDVYHLIASLYEIQTEYRSLQTEGCRKQFFLDMRDRFNSGNLTNIEEATLMIFLNRTCFNGLYRENSKGKFNVPFGKYPNPTICDEELLLANNALLQKVEITRGDFASTLERAEGYTIFYLDPPYRPLDATSSFNSYVKEAFDDSEQVRLKKFFDELTHKGYYGLLSNSDGASRNPDNRFFDELYSEYYISRVKAKRQINANPSKRGTLNELLIRNFHECNKSQLTII